LGRNAFRTFVVILISSLCVAPFAFAQSVSTQSQRAAEIRLLAATCSTCHGTDGNALGAARRLSGVAAEDLSKALLCFRDGSLSSTVMREITQAYTPETLVELATHFAAQKARSAK
jgi:sulfide dehydrogenase cytochrome subunit